MKRVLLIFFVLVAAVGACFAVNGDVLLLQTSVSSEAPSFDIYGKGSGIDWVRGSQPEGDIKGANVAISNPATSNVVLEVKLVQPTFSRYKGSFKLTIEASELYNTDKTNFSDQKTALPSFVAGSFKSASVDGVSFDNSSSGLGFSQGESSSKYALTVSYSGVKVGATNDLVGFKFEWAQKESLAPGNYEGTVKLICETTT